MDFNWNITGVIFPMKCLKTNKESRTLGPLLMQKQLLIAGDLYFHISKSLRHKTDKGTQRLCIYVSSFQIDV